MGEKDKVSVFSLSHTVCILLCVLMTKTLKLNEGMLVSLIIVFKKKMHIFSEGRHSIILCDPLK